MSVSDIQSVQKGSVECGMRFMTYNCLTTVYLSFPDDLPPDTSVWRSLVRVKVTSGLLLPVLHQLSGTSSIHGTLWLPRITPRWRILRPTEAEKQDLLCDIWTTLRGLDKSCGIWNLNVAPFTLTYLYIYCIVKFTFFIFLFHISIYNSWSLVG